MIAIDPLLLSILQALKYANGAYLIVACAAAGVLISSRAKPLPAALPLAVASPAAFFLLAALGLAYAFYPNFLDHAEPAMATLGMALMQGRPLYPPLDDYGFRGLLYGPLVAETQAVAIYLGATLGGLPVLLASKLAGVLAFLLASALFFRLAPGWGFARAYYLLFLLPFGILAFWNRCEPVLLLLVAASFWAADACPRRIARPAALLILGLCAGLASGLKLHACLYIAPAAAIVLAQARISVAAALILGASAAGTFLLLFLPGNVSLPAFFGYLQLAAGHGLSGKLFLNNLVFLGALWSPLLVLPGGWRLLGKPPLLALGVLQLGVAVIASKPGAGIHHLLPFIPANALLFAAYAESSRNAAASLVWLAALLPGLAASALLAFYMARDWRTYDLAGKELAQIQAKYPDLVMGAGGSSFYPYAFMRPMLALRGTPQVEYSSYMDLQLIGVPDVPLQQAFESCQIKHLAIPRREPPFSMTTYYSSTTPLFSDELREMFRRRFVKTGSGTWFDAYECVPRKD
jgi:hypothetical protein